MDVMELFQHRLGIFMGLKEGFQQKMGRGSALETALIEELTNCVGQAKTNAIAADVEKFGNDTNDILIATLAVNVDESMWCKCLEQAAAVAMNLSVTDPLNNVDLTTMAKRVFNRDSLCMIELLPEHVPLSFEAIECAPLEVFFGLGIVNPMGPTFSFVAALGDWKEGNVMPVVKVMLNPFSQSVEEVARLKVGARWEPMHDLEPLIQLGFGSCPTLVLLSARIPEISRLPLATKILESFGNEVVANHDLVSSHFGDPWTRVSAEMKGAQTKALATEKQGAWRRFSAMMGAAQQRTESSIPEAEAGRRLAQLVLQPQHVWAELQALLFAWNGSIHKTGIPEQMAAGAFPEERFKKFLLELVCPSLWLPAETSQEAAAQPESKPT